MYDLIRIFGTITLEPLLKKLFFSLMLIVFCDSYDSNDCTYYKESQITISDEQFNKRFFSKVAQGPVLRYLM